MDTIIDNNLIVFESMPDFADNSRGFYEYIKSNTSFDTFWIIRDKKILEILKDNNVKCALYGTKEANEKINTAHYFVTSSFEFAYYKKPGQIHISAWHGFPLKLIGFFDSASATTDFQNLKVITTQTDIVTATSRFSQLTLSGQFSLDPRKVKNTGYPRNDIMLTCDAKKELLKITDIDIENNKLFLYLPTMRKGLKNEGGQFVKNILNYNDYDLNKLESFLENNNVYIFVKMHFADNIYFKENNFSLPKRIIFIDTDILNEHLLTIYHIIDAFDALITDYSSIYVDYLLLNKPIIFSCPDISEYQKDRGFIIDNPRLLMPGDMVQSQYELINALQSIISGNDKYMKKRYESIDFFHAHKDSNSSKRLYDEMINFNKGSYNDVNKEVGRYFVKNNTPLSQYMLNATAEIYYDFGNGFNEINKLIKNYNVYEQNISFCIDIPTNTHQIRFDPDYSGRWIISELNIKIDGIDTDYDTINIICEDNQLYLCENDPQIYIKVPSKAQQLLIEFKCDNIYDEATKLINNLEIKNHELETKLEEMENSRSWKITKPLRKLSNLKDNKRQNIKK